MRLGLYLLFLPSIKFCVNCNWMRVRRACTYTDLRETSGIVEFIDRLGVMRIAKDALLWGLVFSLSVPLLI